jgi:hypothetical protein
MAKKPAIPIPEDIKIEVQNLVDVYNKKYNKQYKVIFKNKYCLLSRIDAPMSNMLGMLGKLLNMSSKSVETQIGRLEWTGDINKWSFAVYKYSRDGYDPNEWMFPGAEKLDGTIVGAMNAGLEIYP